MPTAEPARPSQTPARSPDAEPWAEVRGDGPPLVLLHGLADTHELWRHQVPILSTRYTTIAVDHFGHGRSPLPPGPLNTPVMADGIATLLDRLGLGPAVVVGLSMGGGVAQVLALRRPDLVRALVLVSTSSDFPPATRERFVARAAVAEREGMAAVVDTTVPRWFTEAYMAAHPDEVALTRETVLANDPVAFAAASRANAVRDWSDRLGEIRCPVLFIGGDGDPADARRSAATYRDRLPDVRIEIVDGVSHLVPVESPERFNRLLLGFLDELGYS
jgi:3-oxoadipate enol-lactonase